MMPWRAFFARVVVGGLVLTLAVFAGVRLATAVPGGPTRDALTYAGVLRERAGMANTRLTFVFNRGGGAARCTTTTEPFTPDDAGAFSVPVPLSGSGCPNGRSFFDGDDVQFDVRLGDATGDVIASNALVTPVPYARFADQTGVNNDCPVGYVVAGRSPHIICQLRVDSNDPTTTYDEVVKVGLGATAFWIDRYEATVWTNARGVGTPLGTVAADYPAGFPSNGQWRRPPRGAPSAEPYALSRAGSWFPSRFLTWFQAQAACRNVGKRLPSGEEWLAAADGSDDLLGTTSDGGDGRCVTAGAVRGIIFRPRCLSAFGAQDMIGNVAEWTSEWYAGAGAVTGVTGDAGSRVAVAVPIDGIAVPWPDSTYGNDGTFNVAAMSETEGFRVGLPAAARRGGAFPNGSSCGIFTLDLSGGPTQSSAVAGFRCVIPR